MADDVGYTPGVGATVAADEITGVLYQRIKVVVGSDGTNLGDVGPTNPIPVTGTIAIPAGLSVTVVSGTFSVKDIIPVTTAASVSVSGVPVWMNPTQPVVVNTITAGFSVNALVTGTVSVSGPVQVSGTVTIAPTTFTVNTAVTVAGASVTIQQGVSVSAVVSGTIGILNVVPVVTQASVSVTGLPVWFNPTAALGTVVTQLGTQMVSIAQTSVSMAALPTVNTIVTILGTQVVTVVPGLSVSAVVSGTVSVSGLSVTAAGPSVAATGIVVWLAGGQSSTAWPVVITGTVTAGAGTTVVSVTGSVLVSGTVSVSAVGLWTSTAVTTGTAQAVWIMNPTTVTVTINGTTTGTVSLLSIVPVTTQVSVSVSGIPVWFNAGALVSVSGTAVVSVVPGLSVSAVVSGTISNSGILFSTGLATVASTGQIVIAKDFARAPVQIFMTATAVAQSVNKYLFTIWTGATGAPAAAGTTSWAVPAGKVLRLNNIQIAMTSSAVLGGSVQVFVGVGATASMISASISTQLQVLKIQVFGTAAMVSAGLFGAQADVQAGESICVFIAASTAVVSRACIIQGYLF